MKWRAELEFLVCFNCSGQNYQTALKFIKKSLRTPKELKGHLVSSLNLFPAWNTKSDHTILHSWNDWVSSFEFFKNSNKNGLQNVLLETPKVMLLFFTVGMTEWLTCMGRDAGCGEQTDSIDPLLYVQGRWNEGDKGEIFAPSRFWPN